MDILTATILSFHDAKYAVASSSSRTFIERALYRAENGLQAYETSGSDTIDYPVKKD